MSITTVLQERNLASSSNDLAGTSSVELSTVESKAPRVSVSSADLEGPSGVQFRGTTVAVTPTSSNTAESSSLSSSESSNNDDLEYPEGGLSAWRVVLGSFLACSQFSV